jgi:hypothetical protein
MCERLYKECEHHWDNNDAECQNKHLLPFGILLLPTLFLRDMLHPNDPKLSHGHGRLAHVCNLDSQISYLNPKLKGQWPLAPARC